MARFLFNVLPEGGHVSPTLPVAYALRAAGHAVAYLMTPAFTPLLQPHGITIFPYPEPVESSQPFGGREDTTAETGASPVSGLDARDVGVIDTVGTRRAEGFRRKFIDRLPRDVAALGAAVAAWHPDVLVNDSVSYGATIVAEQEGLPLATLNVTTFSWPSENLGPFGLGLPPAADDETRRRYAALRVQADGAFDGLVEHLNAMRARYGLPPRPAPLPLATLSPYLQMLPTIPELDYERDDLPPQVHYIGPCSWEVPATLDPTVATWLERLPPERPLALVTASTGVRATAGLVHLAARHVAGPALAILATLPFDSPLHQIAPSDDLLIARFVSYDAVLPRCQVVVTHGGFGTVTKALRYRHPLVIVPYGSDQLEVAQRVVQAGAALRLSARALDGPRLREAMATITSQRRYRVAAERLAAALDGHDGPHTAVALLVRLAVERRPIYDDKRRAPDAIIV